MVVLYGVCYVLDKYHYSIESSRFKWIFYFGILLIGGHYFNQSKNHKKIDGIKRSAVISILMLIAFYGLKFCLIRYGQLMPFQFFEHIILGIFIYELFALFLNCEKDLRLFLTKIWWKPIQYLSEITLEIFLVMDYIHCPNRKAFSLSNFSHSTVYRNHCFRWGTSYNIEIFIQ